GLCLLNAGLIALVHDPSQRTFLCSTAVSLRQAGRHMYQSRQAQIVNILTRNDVVEEETGEDSVHPMLALCSPSRGDWPPSTLMELGQRMMERTPSLFPTAHFEVKELPQVVTQGGNKGGILPPRA